MNETLFEKISTRKIPAVYLYEDELCIVILDKFPNTKGQSLIIPKQPTDYIFDVHDELYTHCFLIAKKIAKAIDASDLKPTRTCLVVEGFEVPHAHIKLFPVYKKSLDISSGTEADGEYLEIIAKKIKAYL